MTKDKLLELKAIAEQQFNSIASEVKQLETAILEKNTEATKLQGDFRTLEKLIESWIEPITENEELLPVESENTDGE